MIDFIGSIMPDLLYVSGLKRFRHSWIKSICVMQRKAMEKKKDEFPVRQRATGKTGIQDGISPVSTP